MGLYDTIEVYGGDDSFFTKEGRRPERFQTKDLDCSMAHYVIDDRLLFLCERDDEGPTLVRSPSGLYLESKTWLRPSTMSAVVKMYSEIRDVDPVLVLCDNVSAWNSDLVHEHFPYFELQVNFDSGVAITVKTIEEGTRASLREELHSRGLRVLEDNEQIAVLHLKKREAKKLLGI